MNRRDRRELSLLGALLLTWAFVAAPIVHVLLSHVASAAAHSHGHSHGSPPAEHGQGSLEHGRAVFGAAPSIPPQILVLVALATAAAAEPSSPFRAVWPRVEKSQGP